MQSRRDQVQAYFFVVGRLISAMMRGRPDEPSTPTRRFVTGAVIGTLLGGLVLAGFGVYGMLRPGGNTSWQQAGTIIVEKETGARYLYDKGTLRPVLNYSSALLAANSPSGPQVQQVSRNSLKGAPRSVPIGIPGAPDSLPDANSLTRDPWIVCATSAGEPSGASKPATDLQVRRTQDAPLPDDQGILVSTPDGEVHLVWQGKQFRLPDQGARNTFFPGQNPYPVTAGWINTLPSGPDLTAPDIENAGQPADSVEGKPARVGQVFLVRDPVLDSSQYYLLRPDGFAPLNDTLASLLLADPDNAAYTGQPRKPTEVGMEVLSSRRTSQAPMPNGFPDTPPKIQPVDEGSSTRPCAVFRIGPGNQVIPEVGLVPSESATGSGRSPAGGGGATVADRITVPPNSGVLARDLPTPGVGLGALYLISDLGAKYPLPSPEIAAALGYSADSAVAVPGSLLNLLPTGPALDPAKALDEQPVSSATPAAE